jgi:hypothetical protein
MDGRKYEAIGPGEAGGTTSYPKPFWIFELWKRLILAFQTTFWGKFLILTIRNLGGSKAKSLLGFLSCLVVVLVVSLMITVIRRSQIFLLSLAVFNVSICLIFLQEAENGEIDFRISALSADSNLLNYTKIRDILPEEEFSYNTVRFQSKSFIYIFDFK